MVDNLIEINNISKSFGSKKILQNTSMNVKKGQSIALLGHNGCGKSTLLRILCGLTSIDSGKVNYSRKLKFNYVPENFPKMNLSAIQYIRHIGLIEGVQAEELERKSNNLFQAFFVEEMIDSPMKHLSKGTLQKIGVIQALLTKPDILLLDEPLSGQDLKSQKVFISLINNLNKEGTTIVMSCHERFLVNMVSDTVYEIKDKKIEQIEFDFANKNEFDVLIFNKPNKECFIPTDILELACKIENGTDKIKMVADIDKSNEIIKRMLDRGYVLRRMVNE